MTGIFSELGRVLPDRYPAGGEVDEYIDMERGVGRVLDYGVIGPRLQLLYEWAARTLDQPALLSLVRDGSPVYAWPFSERRVWRPARRSVAVRLLRRVTAPR